MKFVEYADRDMLAMDVANVIAGELESHLQTGDTASLVVPGGSTPGPVFDVLCAASLDWAKVHVLLSDERWVPETHEQSNAALLRKRLLVEKAAAAQFTPFYSADETIETRATSLSSTLADQLPFTVLVLGMGADMHTASLFPGADGLEAAMSDSAPILCPMSVPGHDIARITLSARALDGAISKHLIITGQEKREALERAQKSDRLEAPVSAVLKDATIHWTV